MVNALFKFSSAKGALDILKNNSIFITSPLDLNDPFEMRPAWTNEHENKFYQDQLQKSQLITGMPIIVAHKDKFGSGGNMPYYPPQSPINVEHQRGIADRHNEPVFRDLHSKFRILSLVSSLFNLDQPGNESDEKSTLMWAHYADKFQGVCLALDPSQFDNGLQQNGFPVKYLPTRQELPPSHYNIWSIPETLPTEHVHDPESNLYLNSEEKHARYNQKLLQLLSHKSPVWQYENEVRMIYDTEKLQSETFYRLLRFPCMKCWERGITDPLKCKNSFFKDAIKLPASAILAVIFGHDCMFDMVDKILSRHSKISATNMSNFTGHPAFESICSSI
ncbi:MAG: DUF2971 domain-containing protein [Verrucomicrobiia bacterium]